jgi:hypothetical protein
MGGVSCTFQPDGLVILFARPNITRLIFEYYVICLERTVT